MEKKLEENRVQNKKILEHKKRYETLEERLSTLPDKISHQVMIPFTTKVSYFWKQRNYALIKNFNSKIVMLKMDVRTFQY